MPKHHSEAVSILLAVVFVAFLASPLAFPKDKKEWPEPMVIFMDPDFKFSQVDNICLAPVLDLRSDKSAALSLTERGPSTGFFPNERIATANQALAGGFKGSGYPTSECDPVNATLDDLRSPSDAWLRNLNFGKSNWLFVVAVEDVHSSANWLGGEGGYAIVSGLLFQQKSGSARLVWRDRSLGVVEGGYTGRKKTVERGEDYIAVNNGIGRLILKFERRSRGRLVAYFVENENFDTSCDRVWTALKDRLSQDPKKYRAAFLDASDKMALYTMIRKTFAVEHEDHVVLRPHENGCVMELTQGHSTYDDHVTHDWDELAKQMHTSLAK